LFSLDSSAPFDFVWVSKWPKLLKVINDLHDNFSSVNYLQFKYGSLSFIFSELFIGDILIF
jgi:hypothetical protein